MSDIARTAWREDALPGKEDPEDPTRRAAVECYEMFQEELRCGGIILGPIDFLRIIRRHVYDWPHRSRERCILEALSENLISVAKAIELFNEGGEPPLVEHGVLLSGEETP